MRTAMAEAEVGDAEYEDDPTVRRLQERAAELTGTEAAIYLVTGTMCNQIAMHVFARPGHIVVCAQDAHVAGVEGPTSALLSSLTFRQVPTETGVMAPDGVEAALEPDPDRGPIVDLIAVENTHQFGGGTPWSLGDLRAVADVARRADVPLHMDGSRIFNASAATGTAVSAYAAEASTTMFCLSKGLGAPIGSMLCGPADVIEEARKTKLLFGISWRQAGITAAAGIVALDEGPDHLLQDHEHARLLAAGLAETTPGAVEPASVRTNIVFADPSTIGRSADETATRLAEAGVSVNVVGHRIRFVTHRDVSGDDIRAAVQAWRTVAHG